MSDVKQSENQVLITPGSIKTTIENHVRLSRDLKNLLNKVKSTLRIEIDGSGAVVNVSIRGEDASVIANASQIAGMGGIRRFVLGATKEAEKETADHEKMMVAKKLAETEGVSIKKIKPDANGRVSELIRMAKNAEDNRRIINQWDDDDLEGISKKYVLANLEEVLNLVKDEIKNILVTGKNEKDFLEEGLKKRLMLKWFYEKLTSKNGITASMAEPIDFLFPKNNYQNGVNLTVEEAKTVGMIEKHWLVTNKSTNLIATIGEYVADVEDPKGRDAKRQTDDYLNNVKILLVPQLKPMDMIERYKDSKHKTFEQNKLPDGEAGRVLKKKIPTLSVIQNVWHEYFRFIMFKEIDSDSFWKKIVDPSVHSSWNLTIQQNVKYWVNELAENDIMIDREFDARVYDLILGRSEIYDGEMRDEFISKYAHRTYFTCAYRCNYIEQVRVDKEKFPEIKKDWENEYNAMPEGTDEEKAEKKEFWLMKPQEPKIPKFSNLNRWGGNKNTQGIMVPRSLEDKEAKIKDDFQKGDYAKVLPKSSKEKVHIEKEDEERYLKFFKGIKAEEAGSGGAIGIADKLNETSVKFMEMLKKNEKYGKALKPKVENWLRTTFVGSKMLQEIAAEAIVTSLQNQDFYEEIEEE